MIQLTYNRKDHYCSHSVSTSKCYCGWLYWDPVLRQGEENKWWLHRERWAQHTYVTEQGGDWSWTSAYIYLIYLDFQGVKNYILRKEIKMLFRVLILWPQCGTLDGNKQRRDHCGQLIVHVKYLIICFSILNFSLSRYTKVNMQVLAGANVNWDLQMFAWILYSL